MNERDEQQSYYYNEEKNKVNAATAKSFNKIFIINPAPNEDEVEYN